MLRGLWKLTWIEIKIFLREPLGAFGTIGIPVLVFVVTGRIVGHSLAPASLAASSFITAGLPVLAAVLIAISAVLSLVTIISIYREGGILKRLRATPLRPQTILTAHVLVKLLLTAATLALMVLAGKRYYPVGIHVPLFAFTMALLISTCSILDRLSNRQHRSHSAFRAAHRRRDHVPDDRCLGTLRAGCIAAALAPGGR
jgi:ABC-2 type transport system permease protein